MSRQPLQLGDEVPELSINLTREDLTRYAQLSGDHNPIHQDDAVAAAVGLPGVIAHGMLTMGLVSRVLIDHIGDAAALVSYGARFTRPVLVPPLDAHPNTATLSVSGKVTAVDDDARTATVAMSAVFNGQTVLARTTAVIRQP
jgi:acyl dehydratase